MPKKIFARWFRFQPHIWRLCLTLTVITVLLRGALPVAAQGPAPDARVEAIFNALTPDERVGQLFVVSFRGRSVGTDDRIAQLIRQYRIGGVVISAAHQNFSNDSGTPAQVIALTNALQRLAQEPPPTATLTIPAFTEIQPAVPPITPTITPSVLTPTPDNTFVPLPLFIAVEQEGNGFPYTQIRGGLVELPSQMALGATWNEEYARQVGQTVGMELSLMGVNMLLGPPLDVLDNPRPERGVSLGTRTFGGHPFWVGKLGKAYIEGVHQGSGRRVLTIAKHFPGFGSSDRRINQGVPTILKSLDDMRQTELFPFFQVTRLPADGSPADGVTDGLMTAHVRYQGLPGTVPISLDARNLPTLLALKELTPWRTAGGLVVSAPLGVPAALEGIAAAPDSFPDRRLAQDAFLAGSDLLLLVDFAFPGQPDTEFDNIVDAIRFFREKYASDPNFQAAVDRAVRRIIKAKLKIYGDDLLKSHFQNADQNLKQLTTVTLDVDEIAQQAATLVTPLGREGTPPLSAPPQPGDSILIFTDDRLGRECPTCPNFPLIETDALEQVILQLFGPDATGQISPAQIRSLTFSELQQFAAAASPPPGAEATVSPVETPTPTPTPAPAQNRVARLIADADWIIFNMLSVDPETFPPSTAVRDLLRNRYDAVRGKTLVLFAFDAPYFLDETEISQLTAYYAFYSKQPAYIRTAARLLFQQFQPQGASPVTIPAIGPLDLSPNPNQTITLTPIARVGADGTAVSLEQTEEPVSTLDLQVGEAIVFRTNVIVDRYGHPVPDGTLVDFFRFYPLEGLSLEPLTAQTVGGVAEITIVKERDTPLQVRASSGLAVQGVPFNIGPGIVDIPTPTPTPTPLPTPTPTETPVPTDTPTPVPSA
ncbi:MAG: hypothetical protein D6784_11010, partial [Chloroflexi bacterium]